MINESIITKGKVSNFNKLKKLDKDYTYTRLFTGNIQDMYNNCSDKSKKQLANLFKMLPFINFKHNVFCLNTNEEDKSKLQLLTWTDLAKICGYEDNKNISKFKKDMLNLEIYEGISTLGTFVGAKNRHMIVVNPKIFYGGNDVDDVRQLYAMFNMIDKSDKNSNIN